MNRLVPVRWAAVAFWLTAMPGAASAQTASSRVSPKADLEALQAAFAEVAEVVRPSVVAIRADRCVPSSPDGTGKRNGQSGGSRQVPSVGSGVIIREDGMILTNEHVVQGADRIVVALHDGSSHEAAAVYSDSRSDLAVVEIDAEGLRPATLGDISRVRQGHWAFAMGNPFGLAAGGGAAMSQGIVSAVGQRLRLDPTETRYYGNLIQTSAAINPGNSGGPLVNIRGEVIGITTAISTRTGGNEGVGFAVPMEARTKAIIEKLLAGEPVEYGFIGVAVRISLVAGSNMSVSGCGGGAVIDKIEPGSPADKAKLAEEDIIVEFDGILVEDADHLVRLVGAAVVGRPVSLTYCRKGRSTQTYLTAVLRRPPRGTPLNHIAWRGMTISEPTRILRQRFGLAPDAGGLLVVEIEPNSAADRAGIKPGRRILKVGEAKVETVGRLGEIIPGLTKAVILTLADHDTVEVPPP